jgi:hypothetical protein
MIDSEGYRPDPRSSELIRSMECPRTGDDLARVLGILQWMAHSIPRFAEMASPLRKVLEDIYKDANSRESKKVRSRIVTMFGWTKEHTKIWNQIKEEMAKALTLTHRDPKKVLHLFTDASQTGWAGILVQVDREEIEKHPQDVLERKFEPLGCMGGNFDSAQFNWPTVEQEGYAVKRSIERMWYHIDDGSELQIYSDNLNLKSIFDPHSDYISKRATPGRGRLLRWCAWLNQIPHKVHHISGKTNLFADVLSRIRGIPPDHRTDPEDEGYEPPPALSSHIFMLAPSHGIRHSLESDWVHPSIQEICDLAGKQGQEDENFHELAKDCKATFDYDERVWKVDNKVLIPEGDIRTKLVIMAHMHSSGHRGAQTTYEQLEPVVFWPRMKEDVTGFVASCIHCKANVDHPIERPYGKPIMATERNQVLSMDYLHLGLNQEGSQKILVLTDRLSGFSIFYPAESENPENATSSILDWIAMFGVPQLIISDQSPAFKNAMIEGITKVIGTAHHFTTARVHSSHGRQERLNHIVGTMFRKLLSENQLESARWNELLPVV